MLLCYVKNSMLTNLQNSGFLTCSASTTASNSHNWEKNGNFDVFFQGEVMCDWLSFRHDFDASSPTQSIDAGRTLKITVDGEVEYEKLDFTQIRCPSSDTSIRVKCDGNHLWFHGNIGRFQQPDNVTGISVIDCFDKASEVLRHLYPHLDLRLLGSVQRQDTPAEYGTYLTRLDLTSNFITDSYLHLSQILSSRRIGQKLPRVGKYGAMWGYDSKRGQYWKAKLYDKQAEQDGKRSPYTHDTLARFEVQLGSEYLRQNKLNTLSQWGHTMKTENIIYGKFANQVFNQPVTIDRFVELPPRLRQHAIMYRNGTDPKTYLSKSVYYRVRAALLDFGLDISLPCNIEVLKQQVKIVTVSYAPTLRVAA